MTSEFKHYEGCKGDVANCSACALTDIRQERPNYAAWPLAYMENNRTIPAKWRAAFVEEMTQTRNVPYADNIKATLARCGVRFDDGKGWKPKATEKRP